MRTFISTPIRLNKVFLIANCILLLLITCQITSFAQNPNRNRTAITMKGRVVDESGNGLQGATVSEKGRINNSTSTTADGGFTLNVQSPEADSLFLM